jgi:hypothetical protein
MQFSDFYKRLMNETVAVETVLPIAVQKIAFKKGDVLTPYNAVEANVYFLNYGIVELKIKSYTTEKILDFFFANEAVTCLTSFLLQAPSDVEMTAITDGEAEYFTHTDVQQAYELGSLAVNKLGRKLVEAAYLRKVKREKDFLSKTAEERYSEMIEYHKDYILQIPVNKIAKYLGVHPESLSRIRKKMNS